VSLLTVVLGATTCIAWFRSFVAPSLQREAARREAVERGRHDADAEWAGGAVHWQVTAITPSRAQVELSIRTRTGFIRVRPVEKLRPRDGWEPPDRLIGVCGGVLDEVEEARRAGFARRLVEIGASSIPRVDPRMLLPASELAASLRGSPRATKARSSDDRCAVLEGREITVTWPGHVPLRVRCFADEPGP
jgi:hypothetical protein